VALGTNTLGLLFKISADVGQTQAQLKAVTDQLKVGVDGAKGSLSDLGSQFKILSGFLEGLVAGGLTGFIEGVIKAATATADWVNELDRASQATSIEIRTLAQLEGAFKEAGGSLNSMIGTFDIFASKLAQAREGNNKLIDILEKYNITSTDVTQATDEAFKALGSLTDQTEKARLATELFGKGGARQVLQFKDLKDGIKGVTDEYKGLGDAIDPKLIAAAQAYEKESKKLDATLVANRAIIAGLVLPAWVDFNASIRKAIESLSLAGKLAEHANEALDKMRIGPQKPPPAERGIGGEVVTEAEARAATEAGIAARSLEGARKVKDEKVKIAKQQTAGISEADKELERAQKELEAQRKQTGDIIIQNMEDNLKELNQAIAATFDIQKLIDWKFAIFDFAQVVHDEMEGIVRDIAKLGQDIPGGGTGIPGLISEKEVQRQLDAAEALNKSYGGFFEQLKEGFESSGAVFQSFGDLAVGILEGVARAGEQAFSAFILTGKLGGQIFKQFVAQVIAAIAVESLVKSVFEFAEAYAASARGDIVSFWLHTKAANFYLATAALAGTVGLAIGATGGLGGGATAAAGGGGFGGGETTPSPVNINLGGSRRDTLGIQIATLNQSVEGLHSKITSMPAGDVVMIAADQKPEAFATGTLEAGRRSGAFTREFMQISGARA
jgi:hypothetical protein